MFHTHIHTFISFLATHRKHLPVGLLVVLCGLSAVLGSQMTTENYSARTLQEFSVQKFVPKQAAPSPVARRKARRMKSSKVPLLQTQTLRQAAPVAKKIVAVALPVENPSGISKIPEVSAVPEKSIPSEFPVFGYTVMPVSRTPNWGAMRSAAEWNKSYGEMTTEDFVSLPRYDVTKLKTPLDELAEDLNDSSIALITAKLFYSTRFFGAYDLDSGEFEASHPGVDLKLARGTPIGAIAGGKVHAVKRNDGMGLHVIVEHHLPDDSVMFSIYGHFDIALVDVGDDVSPGTPIGAVGMTGNTSAPHLHLQVDTDTGARPHKPYWPSSIPSRLEAAGHTVNPLVFIAKYGK